MEELKKIIKDNRSTLVWCYCACGNIKFFSNNICFEAETGDFFLIMINSQSKIISSAGDAKVLYMQEDYEDIRFQSLMAPILPTIQKYQLHNTPIHRLTEEQRQMFLATYRKVSKLQEDAKKALNQDVKTLLEYEAIVLKRVFLLEFTTYLIATDSVSPKKNSRGGNLTNELIILINEHCKKERHPAFYAKKMNVSLSTLENNVLKYTGNTPKMLIDTVLVNNIKRSILIETLRLKDLAEDYGFNSVTTFSSFFKRHVGISYTEYVKQVKGKDSIE